MQPVKVVSEIAGFVRRLDRSPGDRVEPDDTILTLESMKMEIPVHALQAGIIVSITVVEGDVIEQGQVVALITS